jgi:hypothetical protein
MLQVAFQPSYLYANSNLIQQVCNQQNPVQSKRTSPLAQRERARERQRQTEWEPDA